MEISLTDFVFFTVCAAFIAVMSLSALSRFLHFREEQRARASRVVCRLCQHVFDDHGRERVVICPACGAATEKGRSHQLG